MAGLVLKVAALASVSTSERQPDVKHLPVYRSSAPRWSACSRGYQNEIVEDVNEASLNVHPCGDLEARYLPASDLYAPDNAWRNEKLVLTNALVSIDPMALSCHFAE
jgi:hypothetical protein